MPDTLIGATVKVDDFPRTVNAIDATQIDNISSTTFISGSPVVATTFVAPTSGMVLLSVSLGARDNGGSTARVHLAPEVRVGSAAGSVFLSADVTRRGVGTPGEAADFAYRGRTTLLTGLTAGQVYYVSTLHKVSGGATADIAMRDVTVTPIPFGGGFAGQPIRAADFPPAVWAQDITTISNPTNTSYAAGSPEVSVTFTAPTSGRALIIVGGGAAHQQRGRLGPHRVSDQPRLHPRQLQ
jgi:hypothetical protein